MDGQKPTGGGKADIELKGEEIVMHHIMGEGAVLKGVDGGIDTEDEVKPGISGTEPTAQDSSASAQSAEPQPETSTGGKTSSKPSGCPSVTLKDSDASTIQLKEDNQPQLIVESVGDAQKQLPHLKDYNVICNGKCFHLQSHLTFYI